MACWNAQGQSAKKQEIANLIDELRSAGESYDILTLLEFRGKPNDEWFWHEGYAVIMQKYGDSDHMWMCRIVRGEVLDHVTAYKAGKRW